MALYEIKSWLNGSLLYSLKCESLALCAEAAVKVGANLTGAYLTGANLTDAYLTDANLTGAYLTRAKLPAGAIATKPPVQLINVLPWTVTILGSHVLIGCQLRPATEWESMSDDEMCAELSSQCDNAVELRREWLAAISFFRDREGERLWAEQQQQKAEV